MALRRVAVILAGSGVYDGSEIHEASAVMVNLSRHNITYDCFAPNKNQAHVIDHTKGAPAENENRNVLTESARIARGEITALDQLESGKYSGIIIPGGFGAAKNLSSFALDGPEKMTVDPNLEQILKDFHKAKKPIGMCCIAPIIAAKIFPGCSITMGQDQEMDGKWPFAGAAQASSSVLNAKHNNMDLDQACVDQENRIVTSAAFMCGKAPIHEIHDSVGLMVKNVIDLME